MNNLDLAREQMNLAMQSNDEQTSKKHLQQAILALAEENDMSCTIDPGTSLYQEVDKNCQCKNDTSKSYETSTSLLKHEQCEVCNEIIVFGIDSKNDYGTYAKLKKLGFIRCLEHSDIKDPFNIKKIVDVVDKHNLEIRTFLKSKLEPIITNNNEYQSKPLSTVLHYG
jgi:hypothetical protein